MANKSESKPMMKGPAGRHSAMFGPKPKIEKGTFKRLFSYITKQYKVQFTFVVICIVISSITSVLGLVSLKTLIDEYITPLIGTENPDFTGLVSFVAKIGILFGIGIVTTYVYS